MPSTLGATKDATFLTGPCDAPCRPAAQADAEPTKASHLLVTVHRCEGLVQQQREGAQVQRPFVHYTPPGRVAAHDSSIGSGPAPVFEDAASWGLVKSAALTAALQQHCLQVGPQHVSSMVRGAVVAAGWMGPASVADPSLFERTSSNSQGVISC